MPTASLGNYPSNINYVEPPYTAPPINTYSGSLLNPNEAPYVPTSSGNEFDDEPPLLEGIVTYLC